MTNSIAPPADARRVYPWESDGIGWSRWFDGTAHAAGPVAVTVSGEQFGDGATLRGVTVVLDDCALLDADEARALAAVLLVAAGELDRLGQ
ncbi:hypothetical protein MINTM001_17140 [Mycobacterium paraintracellulare]|uniref:hypothetical protein n=1 Tax=Mycobacterium paraintracellulare TaxID=1138383 RepID=UPI0019289F31|nr:hypothetical protein [Mycobacterium paraintracellulare]BCO40575.1 hypothetical protein MINTM001_17140 [Mycobacterium paraintracellulare]